MVSADRRPGYRFGIEPASDTKRNHDPVRRRPQIAGQALTDLTGVHV